MPRHNPTLGDVIAQRLARRDLLKGLLATAAIAAVAPPAFGGSEEAPAFNFDGDRARG